MRVTPSCCTVMSALPSSMAGEMYEGDSIKLSGNVGVAINLSHERTYNTAIDFRNLTAV